MVMTDDYDGDGDDDDVGGDCDDTCVVTQICAMKGMIRHKTMNSSWKILMMAMMVMMMKMMIATMAIQTCDRIDDQRSYLDY